MYINIRTYTHTHRLIKHVHIHISDCIHYTQYSCQINIICTVPGTYFIRTYQKSFFVQNIKQSSFQVVYLSVSLFLSN